MTAIRRILCATDLSPASRTAWAEARRLGTLLGADIVLLHVVPTPIFPVPADLSPGIFPDPVWIEEAQDAARKALETLVASTPGPGVVTPRLDEGPAAARILAVADEVAADLIVAGTHGRGALGQALLGSVADRLIRQARCPVLTVPATADGVPRAARLGRICYATDFSADAARAWPWAVHLADAAGAEIDLVHVTPVPVVPPTLPAETLGRMAKLLHDEGLRQAQQFLDAYPRPGRPPRVVIWRGDPGEVLVQRARAGEADLLVMGTHGRSGLVRWMLGSVAHHVVPASPAPVLTVSPRVQAREAREVVDAAGR